MLLISCIILSVGEAFAQISKFDITAFGAVKNSEKVCTKAIQAAIDACNAGGGGDVIIPEGFFLTGTVHLKSKVNLYLQSGAILCGSTNLKDYELNMPEKGFTRYINICKLMQC